MRAQFGIFLMTVMSITVIAQDEYKPFRVGVGLGLIAPQQTLPGFLIYAEPSFRIQKFSIGLRVETAGRPYADIGILGSYTINGQYYFNQGKTRFFGGLGLGAYTVNSAPLGYCSCEGQIISTVAGFYPRVGIERKYIVLSLEANIVQSATQTWHSDVPTTNPTPQYYQAQTSYVSLKVGWNIGVGRKKRIQ